VEASRKPVPRWVDGVIVVAVMLIAAIVRWQGIEFGLPEALHPDEPGVFEAAARLWQTGRLESEMWKYPPLMVELVAVQLGLAQGVGVCEAPCPGPEVLAMGRKLSASMGVLAVGATYGAIRTAGFRPWVAALGATLLAVNPLHTQSSRYVKPDVMTTAFVAMALWGAIGILRATTTPRLWRWYGLAALGIGLAGGAKYNAALVCVAVIVAHFVRQGLGWRRQLPLVLAGVASIAVFALTLAWVWTGPAPLMDGLAHEWGHYKEGHEGYTTEHALMDALGYLWRFGWTPLAMLVLLVGGVFALRGQVRERTTSAAMLALVLVYLALLSRQTVFFARLLIPILPALAIATAIAAAAIVRVAANRIPTSALRLAPLGIFVLVAALPIRNGLRQAQAMARPDTREVAHAWMREHLPKDAYIGIVPGTYKVPAVNGWWRYRVMRLIDAGTARRTRLTHVVVSVSAYDRFTRFRERFPEEAQRFETWHEALARDATKIAEFTDAPLPGVDEFGSTVAFMHHPVIEVWEL
jgi:4-amino-4-deoxy-L-arabinose transferase-like glycosyltransferase